MSNYEYVIHILEDVTVTTSSVGLMKHQAELIAAGGRHCFVDVTNPTTGGGYTLEYLPSGGILHHSLRR